jgi:hypothetical protein
MSTRYIVAVVFAGLGLTMAAAPARADLTTARELYANASYEEALKELAGLEATVETEQVEQVRALCLLALGRTEDAERSLRLIVTKKPLYQLPASEVPPRLVAMFEAVRKEALPAVFDGYDVDRVQYDLACFGDYEKSARRGAELFADFDELLDGLSLEPLEVQAAVRGPQITD